MYTSLFNSVLAVLDYSNIDYMHLGKFCFKFFAAYKWNEQQKTIKQ